MNIVNKLKNKRNELNLTQQELAKKLEVSTSVIGDIESGRRPASKKTAQKLADFFNTSIEFWFNDKETDEYFSKRAKYASLDQVLTTLISNGKIKNSELSDEVWDLIKDAVKIEIKVLLMEKSE